MPTDPKIIETDGRAKLVAILSDPGWTTRKVAREIRSDHGSVACWAAGTKRPGRAAAAALEDRFGIPVNAWLSADERPKGRLHASAAEG
jgi:hypothetical protein